MHCIRSCCQLNSHKKTLWIPPLLCMLAFLVYYIYFCPDCSNPAIFIGRNDVPMCGQYKTATQRTPWFEEHFNGSIEPLLVSKDQLIPDHVLKWWLKIQSGNNASDIPLILEQLFKVVPTGNPYEEQYKRPCRSCAVVGNSGNIKGLHHGEKIDSHDFIFRMNKARTTGFEADVGSRTTHQFMYPESAVHLSPGVHLVLIPFKLRDLTWITNALPPGENNSTQVKKKKKKFLKADKDKVLIFNPTFFKYIYDNWNERHGKYPSTGMLTIIFALHICDEISVFGFGADQNGNWHHYWEKNKHAGAFRRTGVHNAEFETKVLESLATEGILTLYK